MNDLKKDKALILETEPTVNSNSMKKYYAKIWQSEDPKINGNRFEINIEENLEDMM